MTINFGSFTSSGSNGTFVGPLLVATKQYLVNAGVVNQDGIFTYLGNPDDLMDQENPRQYFVVVSAPKASPNQSVIAGGGNFTPVLRLTVKITQYMQLLKDRAGQDSQRVEAATLGLSDKVQLVFSAMQMWTGQANPTGQTTSPLFEPGRLSGDILFTPRKIKLGWASVEEIWELPFQAALKTISLPPTT